jgi:hypothetical protein
MNDSSQNIFSVNDLHRQEERTLKYLNRMQREVMLVNAHSLFVVAARGTGKSEGIDAVRLLQNIWSMPGSTGGLISPSYAKAFANTLPAICKALADWGYIQNLHYYVGRKAPQSANFKLPKRPPLQEAWSNCLHFWNGTVMVILSFSNGMSANSMSLDWLLGPEAKFLNYDKIKSEINPANRGNNELFGDSPWHHSVSYTTDMPTAKIGRWILDKQAEMSTEHIELIKYLYAKIKRLEAYPEDTNYYRSKLKNLRADLAIARRYQPPVIQKTGKLREYTVFYGEYDVFDNLEVLGEDFIWEMYRDSPALVWRTAFLNERLLRVSNCFYSALDDEKHFYIPQDPTGSDFEEFSSKNGKSENCMEDYDLAPMQPLYVAFDANAAISSVCVAQVEDRKMKTLCSMFVKTPLKLQELVDKLCKYYETKFKREVVFYFDHTFVWKSATSDDSYSDIIIKQFEKNGWEVTPVYIGHQPPYEWRHINIDKALKGATELLFPTFNLYNNEFLKIAMEQTGVRTGKNGFEKDKSLEKLDDSQENPDEYKTHITDAWDTLFYGLNVFPTEPSSSFASPVFI